MKVLIDETIYIVNVKVILGGILLDIEDMDTMDIIVRDYYFGGRCDLEDLVRELVAEYELQSEIEHKWYYMQEVIDPGKLLHDLEVFLPEDTMREFIEQMYIDYDLD